MDEQNTETCETLTSFKVISYWIYFDLGGMVLFYIYYIHGLSKQFYKQAYNNSEVKKVKKSLGGYAVDDPSRILSNRESIYNLAFLVNLENDKFEKMEVEEKIRPTEFQKKEVTMTAFFCIFCQVFISVLLLMDFMSINDEEDQ